MVTPPTASRLALPPAAAVLIVTTCSVGEAAQIVRAAGLRAGAGQTGAAERLGADHGADHVAVDVDVAVGEPRHDLLDGRVDARVDAERQAVAVAGDVVEQRVELVGAPAHDVQDRPEHLLA